MLKQFNGNKELLVKVVALLLEDADKEWPVLLEAIENGDQEKGAVIAHGLKGQLGTIGYKNAYGLSFALEKACRDNRFEEAAIHLQNLEKELHDLKHFFSLPEWGGS